MRLIKITAILVVVFLNTMSMYASDRTDALDLMNKCDTGSKMIEIPLKNFGDDKDSAKFSEGLDIIKQGKVRQAQSKYLEAKGKFEEYLKVQGELYESLAAKYIERTRKLIDDIAEDLADFVGEERVLKNFTSASQNLENAKDLSTRKQFENVIQPCRLAKNSVITVYTIVKKDIPKEYLRDVADCSNKIYEEKKEEKAK